MALQTLPRRILIVDRDAEAFPELLLLVVEGQPTPFLC